MDNNGVKLLGEILEKIKKEQPIYSAFKAVCDGTFLQDKRIIKRYFWSWRYR